MYNCTQQEASVQSAQARQAAGSASPAPQILLLQLLVPVITPEATFGQLLFLTHTPLLPQLSVFESLCPVAERGFPLSPHISTHWGLTVPTLFLVLSHELRHPGCWPTRRSCLSGLSMLECGYSGLSPAFAFLDPGIVPGTQ